MTNMGEIFKELRTSRKISLKEATGDEFSYSMLSKFENGESDITISKLLIALENIRTELSEFVYLVRGFQPTAHTKLKNAIWQSVDKVSEKTLEQLYEQEISKYRETKKENYMLNALIIKGHIVMADASIKATEEELKFLYDYLFFVEIWGEYELKLFTDIAPLLPLELYFRYTREMLQKIDFFGDLKTNRNYIHTILLNGFFKAIDEKNLTKAAYFDKQIQNNFYEEQETYFRIVYLYASGAYDVIRKNRVQGLSKMDNAVQILKVLNCHTSADYYEKGIAEILAKFE